MRLSKTFVQLLLAGLLIIPGASAFGEDAKTDPKTPAGAESADKNATVAIVNGKKISREALDREMTLVTHRMNSQGRQVDKAQLDSMQKNILGNMIDRELLYQDALKNGIKPDDTAIDAQLNQMKQKFPDDAEYQKALALMNTTEADLRENIAQSMVIQKFIETKITPEIKVTDEDQKAFYDSNPQLFKKPEQVKASHILIKADTAASDEEKAAAKKKIEAVQDKLKKGEKFDELAKTQSEGPSNVKGGDLGYFSRGQMVKPFEDAAFSMEKGEVSDIVVTPFGYHLIQVNDKKPESTTSFEDAKNNIGNHLKQQKMIESVNAYIEKIKADAKIQVML